MWVEREQVDGRKLTVLSCSAAEISLQPSAPLKSLQLMFRRWTCGADAMMRAMWAASAEVMELWLRSTLVRFVCAATAVAALETLLEPQPSAQET